MCQGPCRVPCLWVTSARNHQRPRRVARWCLPQQGRSLGAAGPPRRDTRTTQGLRGLCQWLEELGVAQSILASSATARLRTEDGDVPVCGKSTPAMRGSKAEQQPPTCSKCCVLFSLQKPSVHLYPQLLYFNLTRKKGKKIHKGKSLLCM